MNTPRGYNPIGQSAPGLPRHDAPLPGHVPGAPSPQIGGGDAGWQRGGSGGGGLNPAYTGPGLPMWLTKPIMRLFFFIGVYLTAPVQAALYPIAGVGALLGAGVLYTFARVLGAGYDTTHEWAWTGCFLGIVALMRTDTSLAAKHPGYATVRRWLRLALSFVFMYYFVRRDQGNSAGQAMVVAAVFTAVVYFVLRSKWLRFVWQAMQQVSWMRKSVDSPLA